MSPMDRVEANGIAEAVLNEICQLDRGALIDRIEEDEHRELIGRSGTVYQVETTVIWDSVPGEGIRILVSVDDGGWSAFKPLTLGAFVETDGTVLR